MEKHVHLGFGFHVNCYHSYRGDTCDSLGFGGDIRTIRYLLDTLDMFNKKGIPVKGTWDFENAYSLEKILPVYAPDIIDRVKVRQLEHGDVNILMGYNNGALSAMTKDEFMASLEWAVSNHNKSGIEDIFGSYERIVRPQETMFTPSDAALYQKAGIEAVCLYYSCVPFDSFRTLIPELHEEMAFNPLTYRYKDGEITILPMYSHADLMDAGSLRSLVSSLHQKQKSDVIKNDVFLFINIDADSFLWEPFPVFKLLRKLPNFNGLEGLINEVADLSYVIFDTPGNYLNAHEPLGSVFFGEDVADGNFSGYSSWSEKPFNRLIWTRLERARMYSNLYKRDMCSPSFQERVLLLSTTHFGLSSPVLNSNREKKALELSEIMMRKEEASLQDKWELKKHKVRKNEIWIKNRNQSSLLNLQLVLDKGFCNDISILKLRGKGLNTYTIMDTEDWEDDSIRNIYIICRFEKIKRKYKITFQLKNNKNKENTKIREINHKQSEVDLNRVMGNPQLILRDHDDSFMIINEKTGYPEFFTANGKEIATWDSWIRYGGEKYNFSKPVYKDIFSIGDGQFITINGEIHLPSEIEAGKYTFRIGTLKGEKGFFVISSIQYPYTKETSELTTQSYNLGRFCDLGWNEVAPMELGLIFQEDVVIEKRNFMGDISSYAISDFWKSIQENHNMDSFNHQLTGGILSLQDREKGIMISHARQVLGSMAHCPMRLHKEQNSIKLWINSFGTYYGQQRTYPTRGNGSMMEIYQTFMPQSKSLAPAYNGAYELSAQWLMDRNGTENLKQLSDREAFADGCIVYATNGAIKRFCADNCKLHDTKSTQEASVYQKHLIPTGVSYLKLMKLIMNYLRNIKFT